jgi:Type II CAAX prenyl endopeptidase Rce1-like
MYALEQPLVRRQAPLLDQTPWGPLATLACSVAGVTTLSVAGLVPRAAVGITGLAAAHGALLGVALAWTSTGERRDRHAPLEAAALLAIGAAVAEVLPGGWVAYLVLPAWLACRRPGWVGAGVVPRGGAVVGGALFGLALGIHLLVSAWLTLDHRVRFGPAGALAAWWAYDLGANVLSAEAFFRAALFERAHRRWAFPVAASLSSGASVIRYLADPLLPRAPEMVAGAAFYLALLGIGNCWLLARTGSLLPPYAAGVAFFAVYRLLAPR